MGDLTQTRVFHYARRSSCHQPAARFDCSGAGESSPPMETPHTSSRGPEPRSTIWPLDEELKYRPPRLAFDDLLADADIQEPTGERPMSTEPDEALYRLSCETEDIQACPLNGLRF